MATYGPVQLPAYFSTDADFRTWGSGIHTALAAIGLVNTADTGQINWTTVTKPIAINTSAGYEIWRLNDTLQSTVPYFFKIEYGTAVAVDRPSMWFMVGSTTNGAGTLSGQTGLKRQVYSALSKSAAATLPVYASGDTSRFALCVNADAASSNYPIWIVCERTRDATGVYTADGLMEISSNPASATTFIDTIPAVGASTWGSSAPFLPVMGGGNIHATATDAALSYIQYFIGKPLFGLGVVEVARVDAGAQAATWTATVFGASHTFLNLLCGAPDLLGITNANNVWWGMLFE
jgi:hypothetical protein